MNPMKTSTFTPVIDHFTITSLVTLAKKAKVASPDNAILQSGVGLSLADIAEVSDQVTTRYGLSIRRSSRLLMDW